MKTTITHDNLHQAVMATEVAASCGADSISWIFEDGDLFYRFFEALEKLGYDVPPQFPIRVEENGPVRYFESVCIRRDDLETMVTGKWYPGFIHHQVGDTL